MMVVTIVTRRSSGVTNSSRMFGRLSVPAAFLSAQAGDSGVRPYVEVKGGGSYTSIESIRNTSAVANPATPQAFGELIRREGPRWAQVVKAAAMKPE